MAYGVNAPFGFKPSVHLSGTPIVSSDQNEYQLLSGLVPAGGVNIYTGDPVVLQADGTITRATAADAAVVLGVFAGVKYTDTSGNFVNSPYWPSGTVTQGAVNALAYVWDAQDILYDVQVANSIVAGLTIADLGQNINVDFTTAGTTIGGVSGATVSAPGAGNTKQFKVVRFTPNPKNAPAVRANNVLVLINTYQWATNSAGI